jgi:hypothetical protein|tara:strand:- start:313 stop:678 length:366 start_codon:yes stop_codon:yes gene_type:complete
MSRLEIILSASLALSILINIGVFTYARAAVARLLFVSEELGDLQSMITVFSNHLNNVHKLEMFYGEPVLTELLQHALSFNEQMETFEYIYNLTEAEAGDDPGTAISPEEELTDDDDEPETP